MVISRVECVDLTQTLCGFNHDVLLRTSGNFYDMRIEVSAAVNHKKSTRVPSVSENENVCWPKSFSSNHKVLRSLCVSDDDSYRPSDIWLADNCFR